MSEEKKLSLSDLGLEEEITPAEKAAAKEIAPQPTNSMIKDDKSQNNIEVKKVDIDMSEFQSGPKRAIPRPDNIQSINSTDANEGYQTVNISDIAKTDHKSTPEDAAKKSLADLAQKVDAGIDRTKQQLTSPGGRIEEGKKKYVYDRYETLMERSKHSANLAKKIKYYQDMMDTDPAFDGADEYEKKGYILYKVAKDNSIGIDDKSFGLAQESIKGNRQTSAEASKSVDKMSKSNSFDTEDTIVFDEVDNDIPVRKRTEIDPTPILPTEKDIDLTPPKKEDDDDFLTEDISDVEDEDIITLKPTSKDDDDTFDEEEEVKIEEDSEEDEFNKALISEAKDRGVSVEKLRSIRKDFAKQAQHLLNLSSSSDNSIYSEYSTSDRTLSVNEALRIAKRARPQNLSARWALQYAGTPIRMTSFSGEELMQFLNDMETGYVNNPNRTPSLDQLTSIWYTIYNHVEMENKPSFNAWLRRIPTGDFSNIIFAIYLALFKDTNYITFRCPKKGCAKLYLEKHDVMDMVKYPNDKVKKRIEDILSGVGVEPLIYKTEPIPINDTFAISFMTPSIYSSVFEQAALSQSYKREHSLSTFLIGIDKLYVIDKARNQFLPIEFGVVAKDLEKTVKRKVRALERIFETFSLDQRNFVMGEYLKVSSAIEEDPIQYILPESKCPVCGTHIPEELNGAFSILFTRAQLSTEAAFIRV